MALVYSDWARLVSLTAGIWSLWGAIWGIFFRKFFWDMIGGTLGPQGLIAPKSSDIFIAIIVHAPIVQILTIINAIFLLALEWPLPFLKGTLPHRSIVFKMFFLFWMGFLSVLVYQTFDAAVVTFIALSIYAKAQAKGESSKSSATEGRGGARKADAGGV